MTLFDGSVGWGTPAPIADIYRLTIGLSFEFVNQQCRKHSDK
jgi:hypothetical protein